jgi:hypothetical protein
MYILYPVVAGQMFPPEPSFSVHWRVGVDDRILLIARYLQRYCDCSQSTASGASTRVRKLGWECRKVQKLIAAREFSLDSGGSISYIFLGISNV